MNLIQSSKLVEYRVYNSLIDIKKVGDCFVLGLKHSMTGIYYKALMLEDGSISNHIRCK